MVPSLCPGLGIWKNNNKMQWRHFCFTSFSSLYLKVKFLEKHHEKVRNHWEGSKGGVHMLMGILRGIAFSREAAVPLTEDMWTLSLWSHPGGLCYGGKSSLSTERQSCPLAGLFLPSWGLCLCSMRLWWRCLASFHIWVILERMILEVKEVCFHWCHLVHPLMPWYLHYLIGDCMDSVIANCALGWLLASLGHWQSGTISVQPLERAVETCLWHTRLFWAARPLVSNEGIRLDQFLLPFLLHQCWGLLCISSL